MMRMRAMRLALVVTTLAMSLTPSRLFAQSPALATQARAQEATLAGRVTDSASQQPVAGVQVVVVGTTLGTRTDAEGNYRIARVPVGMQRVRASLIGFVPAERNVSLVAGQTAALDLTMTAVATQLTGMVVVGYGTQKAATVTGAVAQVEGASLEATPTFSLSNTLGGKLPGVVAMNASGEPGGDGSSIRVRGSRTLNDNSALVVIDGVPDRAGGLERINPRDIESISVLKDASAAIYGSRAANGVILVTTKRGQAKVPELSMTVDYGVSQPTRLPEVVDAATYMTMLNEADRYRNLTPRYSEQQIENFRNGSDPWLYPNTDWFKATLKEYSPRASADASLRGGADRLRYYLSLGAQTEEGYYKNSATRYNQYAFRSNMDGQVNDHLSIQFNLTGRLEDRNYPNRGASEIFRSLIRGKPNIPAYWPNGLPGPDIESGNNPVAMSTDLTGYNRHQYYYMQGTLGGTLTFPWVAGLSLKASANYDQLFQYMKRWRTPWTLYSWDGVSRDASGQPALVGGLRGYNEPQLDQENNRNNGVLLNAMLEYKKDFSAHSVGLLGGAERQTVDYSSLTAFRRYFISDQLDELFAGGTQDLQNGGSAGLARRQNYFARLNYSYADRYLAEFVGREDGSYIFAPGKQFGFFPSVSLGWRVSEERWFEPVSFVDDLKLRASWGRTGNDRIDQWQYLASYAYGSGYVFGVSNEVKSVYPTRTPNPDVTWETAQQLNFGLDATILRDRLSVTLDYYTEKRDDILWQRNASVPQSAGLTLPRENIGKVDSRGLDGAVSYRGALPSNGNFELTVNAGWSANEIKFWDEAPGAPEWQRSTGSRMGTSLYYNAIGIFRDSAHVASYPHWNGARPGDIIFEDHNNDGVINGDDRIRINEGSEPKFTTGLNLTGQLKNVDLTLFLAGATGAVQYIATESGDQGNYTTYDADGRWTPDNPDATKPRTFNSGEYWRSNSSTYYLRDADYLRLKTLQIGYRLPQATTARMGVKNARLYVSGFNLLTWDRMKIADPETRSSNIQYYPQQRVYNTGISFTF